MKAMLVYTSFVTRVIVEDDATEEKILEVAQIKHSENIENDFKECIEEIISDEECPYDENNDSDKLFKHI